MSDLLEQLEALEATENPTTANPHTVDTLTGQQVHKYANCPECGFTPYGGVNPVPHQHATLCTEAGWLVLSSCKCGRYRWHHLEAREPGWHITATPWRPRTLVPTPDVAAWMAGADRATVLP